MEITKEYLEEVVSNSISLREVGRKIKSTNQTVKRLIQKYEISTSHFKHKHAYDHLIGNKYGLLTIKELIYHKDKSGKSRAILVCLCDCGNAKEIRANNLYRCFSCGCKSKDRFAVAGNKNPSFKGVGEICASYITAMKRNAKRRGLEYNLSIEYLWDLFVKQNNKCALTGMPIRFGRLHRSWETTASLDRIDSKIGYTEGNVQWVCKEVNFAKGNLPNDRFIEVCKMVAAHNGKSEEE